MKKLLMLTLFLLALNACKPVKYQAFYDKQNTTKVVLNTDNFKISGTFTGEAIVKKVTNFKKSDGLLAKARENLVEKAEKAGYKLEGSRTFINISIDYIESKEKIKAVITADLIEFTE